MSHISCLTSFLISGSRFYMVLTSCSLVSFRPEFPSLTAGFTDWLAVWEQKCDKVILESASSSHAPSEWTTHIIAAKFGTDKVKMAQKANIRDERTGSKMTKVVNPLWIYSCAAGWERLCEEESLLKEEDDFQSHPVVIAEKKPLTASSSSATHSFRSSPTASTSSSPSSSSQSVIVGTSLTRQSVLQDESDPGDGVMAHPSAQS
jgi:hypothetical protein